MAGVTLDTGALIAAERNDLRFWIWWKWLCSQRIVADVPAPVLAQAWRGARSTRIAAVVAGCRILPMDADGARRSGHLCAMAGSSDVVDAFVVVCAAAQQTDILTSDPQDLHSLKVYTSGVGRIRSLDDLCH